MFGKFEYPEVNPLKVIEKNGVVYFPPPPWGFILGSRASYQVQHNTRMRRHFIQFSKANSFYLKQKMSTNGGHFKVQVKRIKNLQEKIY